MPAGDGTRVRRKAEAVENGAKGNERHEEDGKVEVAQLGRGRGVAARMGDQAQGDGADGDAHTRAELHDGAEKSIGPAHPAGWNFRVRKRSHAGELHRSEGSVEEED